MTEQKPSVGRVVHYVSYGTPPRPDGSQAYTSECRAAVITEVSAESNDQPVVGLCVLNPTGQFFNRGVGYGPALGSEDNGFTALCDGDLHDGGTWHWPARV